MPFKSEKQRKWMWANKPELAKKWSDKYGSKDETSRALKKAALRKLLKYRHERT